GATGGTRPLTQVPTWDCLWGAYPCVRGRRIPPFLRNPDRRDWRKRSWVSRHGLAMGLSDRVPVTDDLSQSRAKIIPAGEGNGGSSLAPNRRAVAAVPAWPP